MNYLLDEELEMEFKYDRFKFKLDNKFLADTLFVAVTGAHAYGWNNKDSDLDIRIVWIPDLLQALSIADRGAIKERKENDIEFTSFPISHFLKLLAKGNSNCLENLFQEKLYSNSPLVRELQEITMKNLHLGFLRNYLGYSNSVEKDLVNPTRREKYGVEKLLLSDYRTLLSGIILGKFKEVVYNLKKQASYVPTGYSLVLLEEYLNPRLVWKESLIVNARRELKLLKAHLKRIINKSKWYKLFPTQLYDRFLMEYYLEGK